MQELRKGSARGHAQHGWLDSYHSFSFADYHDPQHMGFGPLRVINEDRVTAGAGFGTHGHRDMEILSYVLEGQLAHKDNIGNGSIIRPGDLQRMSAGTGVMHSEANPSQSEGAHFLQIWIMPESPGGAPGYEQKHFTAEEKRGRLRLIGARDGRDGAVRIQQDVNLYAGLFDGAEQAALEIAADRLAYVHVARGAIAANGQQLEAGDALKIAGGGTLALADGRQAEVLVFDLPR
jgi:redox-sensitive bicupin YhaK (pirin superfamily)